MAQLVSECDAMEEFIPEGLVLNINFGLLTKRGCSPRSLFFACLRAWGPFLEGPSNLTGPESDFESKVSRKVGCVLTSTDVHFVSLADNLTAPFSKLLKLPSLMGNKTA